MAMTSTAIGGPSHHRSRICFQSNTVMLLAVLVVISMITRLLFMGRHPEGWDSIDFALGLHDYDIAHFQPHFPGYPVYMFFCRLVHPFTDSDVLALTIPGAVFGSITVVPLFYLTRRMFSEEVAWIATLIFLVNPFCWLQSEKALSDTLGLFFIVMSVQLLYYAATSRVNSLRYLISGSVILGICLGVRLSYFPFVILWCYTLSFFPRFKADKKVTGYGVLAFLVGICVWLIPLGCYTGLKPLMVNGYNFTSGHFGDWGGSIVTSQNVLSRFSDFMWCLFCNGLGFWCCETTVFRVIPSFIMSTGIIFYVRYLKCSGFDYKTRFITFYMLPYFLWVFFGQNLEKPRHVLPLIPVIIICMSAGLAQMKYFLYKYSNLTIFRYRFLSLYQVFIGILIANMSIISVRLVYSYKNESIAQIQLLDYVRCNYDGKSTRVYCWETKRFFEYYAPSWDTRRARNIDDLRYDVEASLVTPEVILSTSHVNGINSITGRSKVVVEFKNDRYINNPYHKLKLYTITP